MGIIIQLKWNQPEQSQNRADKKLCLKEDLEPLDQN